MKIVDDYLVVTDTEIAVLFLGEEVCDKIEYQKGILFCVTKSGIFYLAEDNSKFTDTIRIPKATVKEVCIADGRNIFIWHRTWADDDTPGYKIIDNVPDINDKIKANALTIGKNVGELRELVRWLS